MTCAVCTVTHSLRPSPLASIDGTGRCLVYTIGMNDRTAHAAACGSDYVKA